MSNACPACGVEVMPDDRFCGECGHDLAVLEDQDQGNREKIAGKPPAPGQTRRLATIGLVVSSVVLLAVGGYLVMQQDDRGSPPSTTKPAAPADQGSERQVARTPPELARSEPRRVSEG